MRLVCVSALGRRRPGRARGVQERREAAPDEARNSGETEATSAVVSKVRKYPLASRGTAEVRLRGVPHEERTAGQLSRSSSAVRASRMSVLRDPVTVSAKAGYWLLGGSGPQAGPSGSPARDKDAKPSGTSPVHRLPRHSRSRRGQDVSENSGSVRRSATVVYHADQPWQDRHERPDDGRSESSGYPRGGRGSAGTGEAAGGQTRLGGALRSWRDRPCRRLG
jgi:hypothetical protein